MSPLRVRCGYMFQFAGPKRTRPGGKVLIADAERMQRGAKAGPRSAFVSDPSLRASGRRYGSVSRVRSGSHDTSAADSPRSPFAVWVAFRLHDCDQQMSSSSFKTVNSFALFHKHRLSHCHITLHYSNKCIFILFWSAHETQYCRRLVLSRVRVC